MQAELFNMYVERLLKEIEELTKSKLLIDTQLKFTEKMNADLLKKIEELESQIEKQSKKSKKATEESTTVDTF